MVSLNGVAANLERQCALYADLEGVLILQQSALMARDMARLEHANGQQAWLIDELQAAESERRGLVGSECRLGDLVGMAQDSGVRTRLDKAAAILPGLAQRVVSLTRTNRMLAVDGTACCDHMLGLLGIKGPEPYSPDALPVASGGRSLRVDVVV